MDRCSSTSTGYRIDRDVENENLLGRVARVYRGDEAVGLGEICGCPGQRVTATKQLGELRAPAGAPGTLTIREQELATEAAGLTNFKLPSVPI